MMGEARKGSFYKPRGVVAIFLGTIEGCMMTVREGHGIRKVPAVGHVRSIK